MTISEMQESSTIMVDTATMNVGDATFVVPYFVQSSLKSRQIDKLTPLGK